MDQRLGWWVNVVFADWRRRPGPRYQQLAAALLAAVEAGVVTSGTRLPPERLLAEALAVSRGTVVAALEQLAGTGVLRRRQGAGTFVTGRRDWSSEPAANPAAALLLRHVVGGLDTVDLSLSVPANTAHLPDVQLEEAAFGIATGHGLDPVGNGELREEIAAHLSRHQGLDVHPDELVVTAGAQQALALVAGVLGRRRSTLVASCPTYPGLASAFNDPKVAKVAVSGDGVAGMDVDQALRASRSCENPILYIASIGSNPTGSITPGPRRERVADAADSGQVIVVEDLALADLVLDRHEQRPAPIAAMSSKVIAVGSASKLLWAGLRVGWVRAPTEVRNAIVALKAASDLGTSPITQSVTATLLAAIDELWLDELRAAIRLRRDRTVAAIAARLPAWGEPNRPAAGLSLWVTLPVAEADTFVHVAERHGVRVAAGSTMCICGRHAHAVRLSLAEPVDVLDLAIERLAVAWRAHSVNLAAAPTTRR